MKCEICGTELRAEPDITERGWIIFHECIIRGNTEQEAIDNYEKNRASAHNSDYAKCANELCQYFVDRNVIVNEKIEQILRKHFA